MKRYMGSSKYLPQEKVLELALALHELKLLGADNVSAWDLFREHGISRFKYKNIDKEHNGDIEGMLLRTYNNYAEAHAVTPDKLLAQALDYTKAKMDSKLPLGREVDLIRVLLTRSSDTADTDDISTFLDAIEKK